MMGDQLLLRAAVAPRLLFACACGGAWMPTSPLVPNACQRPIDRQISMRRRQTHNPSLGGRDCPRAVCGGQYRTGHAFIYRPRARHICHVCINTFLLCEFRVTGFPRPPSHQYHGFRGRWMQLNWRGRCLQIARSSMRCWSTNRRWSTDRPQPSTLMSSADAACGRE